MLIYALFPDGLIIVFGPSARIRTSRPRSAPRYGIAIGRSYQITRNSNVSDVDGHARPQNLADGTSTDELFVWHNEEPIPPEVQQGSRGAARTPMVVWKIRVHPCTGMGFSADAQVLALVLERGTSRLWFRRVHCESTGDHSDCADAVTGFWILLPRTAELATICYLTLRKHTPVLDVHRPASSQHGCFRQPLKVYTQNIDGLGDIIGLGSGLSSHGKQAQGPANASVNGLVDKLHGSLSDSRCTSVNPSCRRHLTTLSSTPRVNPQAVQHAPTAPLCDLLDPFVGSISAGCDLLSRCATNPILMRRRRLGLFKSRALMLPTFPRPGVDN